MTKLLLSVHVLAAILAIGPIAVAASVFPRFVRQGLDPDADNGSRERADGVAGFLHRICRGYAVFGLAVPVFGFATGSALGVLGDAWLIVSIVLTAAAGAILALAILPAQRSLLADADDTPGGDAALRVAGRLAGTTGMFNLLWAAVVVLMIYRPGSTTGG